MTFEELSESVDATVYDKSTYVIVGSATVRYNTRVTLLALIAAGVPIHISAFPGGVNFSVKKKREDGL